MNKYRISYCYKYILVTSEKIREEEFLCSSGFHKVEIRQVKVTNHTWEVYLLSRVRHGCKNYPSLYRGNGDRLSGAPLKKKVINLALVVAKVSDLSARH